MKTTKTLIFVGSVLASCLATTAMAQFGQPVRADIILGDSVKGPKDQKLGTVKDLAIDLENGRVAEVIVARGGWWGIESKYYAVPPDDFAVEEGGKTLRLNMTQERLEGVPQVDLSKWTDSMAQSRIETTYSYFGITPYFLVPEHGTHAAHEIARHLGSIERASSLIGAETLNRRDEKLGKVDNLIVDLSDGRVIEATIDTGKFLDKHGELSAVPPQALSFDPDRNVLTLNATKETLLSAPHFRDDAQPAIDRDQATAVYQAYQVVPYFLPVGFSSSTQSAPSINNNVNNKNLKPPEQGKNPSDMEITAKIEKEIQDTEGLSADAKAVKITTMDGRVTLSGTVDNPDEKRRLGDIAARVVPPSNVDNRLEIKSTTARAG